MLFKSRRKAFIKKAVKVDQNYFDTHDYYYKGDLPAKGIALMDKVYQADKANELGNWDSFVNIINDFASLRGVQHDEVTLFEPQVLPVALSAINPRFYLGDSAGLGKTIMSLGMYSLYAKRYLEHTNIVPKVLVVTELSHTLGFKSDWDFYGGVKLLALNNLKKREQLELDQGLPNYDGLILSWGSIQTNTFLNFYLRHSYLFSFVVLDETTHLVNPDNLVYRLTDKLVNVYGGGIEHAIMLNGTPIEKNIYDLYYQFKILKPKLISNKSDIKDRYVITKGSQIYRKQGDQVVSDQVGTIAGYQHQAEFRDRIKYYYLGRKKSDFSDKLPKLTYKMHPVGVSDWQVRVVKALDDADTVTLLNSPSTISPSLVLDSEHSPKLKRVLTFLPTVIDDHPLVYVYNHESQKVVCRELKALGYRCAILNGDTNVKHRNEIINKFNKDHAYDCLVFNVQKAINLPYSNRIIFYDIPTMPYQTQQAMARIDRNNYKDAKYYDFFCYINSFEALNLVRLALFREDMSNKFLNKGEHAYHELVKQLIPVFGEDLLDEAQKLIDDLSDEKADKVISELEDLFRGQIIC